MEKENNIEMFEKDLEELNRIITTTTRPNLKRQFEEYKKTLVHNLDTERKKVEKALEKGSNLNVYKDEITYESISKYAFDNSGDSFVK
jgi:exonuclease VII small subunit